MQKSPLPPHVEQFIQETARSYNLKVTLSPLDSPTPTQPISKKYVDVPSAVEHTSLSRWTLDRASKAGELKSIKIGAGKTGKILYDLAELHRWMESHTVDKRKNNKMSELNGQGGRHEANP